MKKLNLPIGKITSILKYGDRINPTRDWFVLVAVSGVMLVASLVWNIFLFSRVTSGETIGTATSTAVSASVQLDSVQTLFSARSAERARYVSSYRFVDPSL